MTTRLIAQYYRVCLLATLCALLALSCLASVVTERRHLPGTITALDTGWTCEMLITGGAGAMTTLNLPHRWESTITSALYRRDVTFPEGADDAGAWLVIQNPVGTLRVLLDGQPQTTLLGNGLTRRVRLHGKAGAAHRIELRLERAGLPPALATAPCGLGSVSLESIPPAHIDVLEPEFSVTLHTVTVNYRLSAEAPENATLSLRLLAPGERRPVMDVAFPLALTTEPLTGSRTLILKRFSPWSPDAPAVYRLQATLAHGGRIFDQWEMPCGLCDLTFVANGARINGRPVTFKGLRVRGGIPPLTHGGIAETLEQELRLAKQAGFNALMTEGAALPEEALELADTLGLLVIADVPPTWVGEDLRATRLDLDAMTDACGHHPCLGAWSWADNGTRGQELANLRAVDRVHAALVRAGGSSQAYGSFQVLGKPFADIDTNRQPLAGSTWTEVLSKAEDGKLPLLVSGVGGDGAETACQDRLCADVEIIRRTKQPLGYFVRPPASLTLTGLDDREGTPTRLFITAAAYNKTCIIVLRPARDGGETTGLTVDAALINDQALTGAFRLYGAVIAPSGSTTLLNQTLTLTGERIQPLAPLAGLVFQQPGRYRVQLALAGGDTVLTSAQLTVDVGAAP